MCGAKDEASGHTPSAALLKATLVNSARRPTSELIIEAVDGLHGDCEVRARDPRPAEFRVNLQH